MKRDRRTATARRHFVTARESGSIQPYNFSKSPYTAGSARRLTETSPYYFPSAIYRNRAAKRLAADSPYITAWFPYKNTSRRRHFEPARDRRAVFPYRELAELYRRVAARQPAAVFSYGNPGKLYGPDGGRRRREHPEKRRTVSVETLPARYDTPSSATGTAGRLRGGDVDPITQTLGRGD